MGKVIFLNFGYLMSFNQIFPFEIIDRQKRITVTEIFADHIQLDCRLSSRHFSTSESSPFSPRLLLFRDQQMPVHNSLFVSARPMDRHDRKLVELAAESG